MTGCPRPSGGGLRQAGGALPTLALISAPPGSGGQAAGRQRRADDRANDLGAVQLASEAGLPFVCSPAIPAPTTPTCCACCSNRMQRWVMPVELSRDWLMQLNQDLGRGAPAVRGGGVRLWSSAARLLGTLLHRPLLDRPKDNCELACPTTPPGDLPAAAGAEGVQPQRHPDSSPVTATTWAASSRDGRGWWMVRLSPEGMETLTMLERFRPTNGDGPPCPCSRSGTATVTGARSPA